MWPPEFPDFVSTFILTDLKGSFETENSLENACFVVAVGSANVPRHKSPLSMTESE